MFVEETTPFAAGVIGGAGRVGRFFGGVFMISPSSFSKTLDVWTRESC